MADTQIPIHYVCTHDRAGELIDEHENFWVCNCGCREARGQCKRSRMDVCLMFTESSGASGTGTRKIPKADAQGILAEARSKNLVARPFRNDVRTDTEGICFCCDDCCGYFLNPAEICDKGALTASTDMAQCNHCGDCVDVCHFGARRLENEELAVEEGRCYGCGLCATVCPEVCVEMVSRG